MIDDNDAHPGGSSKGLTGDELAKQGRMLAYAQQALANTEVDMDVTTMVGVVTLNESWEPNAASNALNIVVSTNNPSGKFNAGVSTPQGPPWTAWIDIEDAHEHSGGVPIPWPGIPPVILAGHTQTMLHEIIHILLRTGNETVVDSAALQISMGIKLDNVKQGACGREFTVSCQ